MFWTCFSHFARRKFSWIARKKLRLRLNRLDFWNFFFGFLAMSCLKNSSNRNVYSQNLKKLWKLHVTHSLYFLSLTAGSEEFKKRNSLWRISFSSSYNVIHFHLRNFRDDMDFISRQITSLNLLGRWKELIDWKIDGFVDSASLTLRPHSFSQAIKQNYKLCYIIFIIHARNQHIVRLRF